MTKIKTCKSCHNEFVPVRPLQRVCSAACAIAIVKVKQAQRAAVKPEKKKPKQKKKAIKSLRNKLWELCKQIIRKRDGNICVICGMSGISGSNWHTGHLIPSSVCGIMLRYDLRNIHSNCYNCNINLGGNGAEYYRRLSAEYGIDFVEAIFADRKLIAKANRSFYEQKIDEYTQISHWDKDRILDHTRLFRIGQKESSLSL